MTQFRTNRRHFLSSSAAAAAFALKAGASFAAPTTETRSKKPVLMKLGCQSEPTDERHLKYLARYGVRNICGYPVIAGGRLYATVEELHRMQDLASANGIQVDMTTPPFLASISVDVDKHASIMLGESPQRDRDIDDLHTMIKNCATAGIPAIKYNLQLVGDLRIARTPGRGDSTYSTWKLAEAKPKTPLTRAGLVNADTAWERITYFLDRVIPVASQYKIRMALHPDDPGVPSPGYQGVERVLGTVDGLKRFIKIQENPYHGLNFCQGTVSEMLANPGTGDLRCDSLLRHTRQDLQRPLPQHSRSSQRLCRDLSGRGRRRLCQSSASLQRGGLQVHAHAGSRTGDPKRSDDSAAILRLRLWLHPRSYPIGRGIKLEPSPTARPGPSRQCIMAGKFGSACSGLRVRCRWFGIRQ